MAPTRKREYVSPLREAQTADTRRRIVEAALDQFIKHGYAKTSVGSIAAGAQVSRETVYHLLGGKQAVLKACWDLAVVGDDAPVAVADREEYRAMSANPDRADAARTFGHLSAALVGRIGPLLRVLADAAYEPDLADVLAQTRAERLSGTRHLLAELSGANPDTAEFSRAVDVVYALISPEVTLVLTEQRDWNLTTYGEWLGEQIAEHVAKLVGETTTRASAADSARL